jgi:NADPH-dependent curcumin reductase CurA
MNDKDLRDCFAMFIACGMVMKYNEVDPNTIWRMADAMLEARRVKEEPQGIVAIKKKRNVK